jgi:tetratricopeptide (TPR) repeat protein
LLPIKQDGTQVIQWKSLVWVLLMLASAFSFAADSQQQTIDQRVSELDEPLYTPFTERYMLDEIRQLRIDLERQGANLKSELASRYVDVSNTAVRYATDTVTNFFYLIAATSSILVILGWTSIKDFRRQARSLANKEVSKLIATYEGRLKQLEKQLKAKSDVIEENREAIETTNEIQSFWMRAAQTDNPRQQLHWYDEILRIRPFDPDALSYKADAALELNHPDWAINLCDQCLKVDPNHAHAHFQMACAYAQVDEPTKAIEHLQTAIEQDGIYRNLAVEEAMLKPIKEHTEFQQLLNPES